MSESLAHGLVTRFARGARERHPALVSQTQQPLPLKRAARYRAVRDLLRAHVPLHHRAMEVDTDPTGKDKSCLYMLLHWDTADFVTFNGEPSPGREDELVLLFSTVRARTGKRFTQPRVFVCRHALMRLFYRLRTMDDASVLIELSALPRCVHEHFWVLAALSVDAQLLVPSTNGAFVLAADNRAPSKHIVKTWISDTRMAGDQRRLHAVAVARAESGVVVNNRDAFPIISTQRMAERGVNLMDAAPPEVLNTLCDAAFVKTRRLPAEWRFRTPEQVVHDWEVRQTSGGSFGPDSGFGELDAIDETAV